MSNKLARIVFMINKLIIGLSLAGVLFSVVMIIIQNDSWTMWFTFLLFNIVLYAAALIMLLLLKRKYPAPIMKHKTRK